MAILVTGGAGYIGSVTVEHLDSRGEKVVVLDNLSRGHREALDAGIPFYHGDAGDAALVERIVQEHEIDSCIHFAAFAYVGESMKKPQLYFENNVIQGLTLFGTLLRAGVRRVIFSSSCVTYGEPDTVTVKEDSRQWPTSPYGWSKLILERALVSYEIAHGLKFVTLRYFNAAGATEIRGEDHDPETHLIPSVLLAASGTRTGISVFGNTYPTRDGTTIRDYIHVSDLADAHGAALNYLRQGGASEVFNLGTGHGYSVMEVIECARSVTKKPIRAIVEAPRPGDCSQLVADTSKSQKVLRWTPYRSDLTTIVRTAWEWHIAHPHGYAAKSSRQMFV
jgi:UDP-glucose 4-epimerase